MELDSCTRNSITKAVIWTVVFIGFVLNVREFGIKTTHSLVIASRIIKALATPLHQ